MKSRYGHIKVEKVDGRYQVYDLQRSGKFYRSLEINSRKDLLGLLRQENMVRAKFSGTFYNPSKLLKILEKQGVGVAV